MGFLLDAAYAATLLLHYNFHRLCTGKYGPCAGEKLGHLPADLSNGGASPVLWIHAVSVGEALAARPLASAWRAAHPEWRILVSTTTATGREVAQKHFGAENVFYYPLDFSRVVRRVFDRIRPDLIVLMELELWPHLLEEAERRGTPVAVSNVRITEKSMRNFRRFGKLARPMLERVSLWASQNAAYAENLRALGVREERIRVVGSLKYDGLDFSEKEEEAARLARELGGGRLLVAGSTHAGEDEIVYAAFSRLREDFGPGLRLALVPRHPERCDAVEALAPAGLSVWRRSGGPAPEGTDVVIGDTMGELGEIYRAAEAVFIGGTFLESVGGHNMLEPAAFARPTVFGPHVHNFTEPARVLLDAGGAVRTGGCDAGALAEALGGLLRDPEAARRMGGRGREAARSMQGATARTLAELEALLSERRPRG